MGRNTSYIVTFFKLFPLSYKRKEQETKHGINGNSIDIHRHSNVNEVRLFNTATE